MIRCRFKRISRHWSTKHFFLIKGKSTAAPFKKRSNYHHKQHTPTTHTTKYYTTATNWERSRKRHPRTILSSPTMSLAKRHGPLQAWAANQLPVEAPMKTLLVEAKPPDPRSATLLTQRSFSAKLPSKRRWKPRNILLLFISQRFSCVWERCFWSFVHMVAFFFSCLD
jgi:hypothetical protein